jgi:AcrR family transcriptional regulator
MPAKKRITRESIIAAAVEIVRVSGINSLNTYTLTEKLNCSTQPIYLSFKNMNELKKAVALSAGEIYSKFLQEEVSCGKYPAYKAYGMGYIKFAAEESGLFALLFMNNDKVKNDQCLDDIYAVIMKNVGLDMEQAKLFHLENWIFVHGIATMIVSKSFEFSEELISEMMSDIYTGLKSNFSCKK